MLQPRAGNKLSLVHTIQSFPKTQGRFSKPVLKTANLNSITIVYTIYTKYASVYSFNQQLFIEYLYVQGTFGAEVISIYKVDQILDALESIWQETITNR